jgi:DNA adenine methylase
MPYPGGKNQNGLLQWIINLIPPHRVFIEAFCGSAAVTRAKRPANESYAIDLGRSPEISRLPPAVRFIQADALGFLANYRFKGDEFIYADPPYLLGTRGRRRYYEHEMTAAQHRRLLAIVAEIPARVMISGYPSSVYDDALHGWQREELPVMTRGNTEAIEVVWFNYPRPTVLHDFGKLGVNHSERVRIRRKVQRWTARLARQDPLERSALFLALAEGMDASTVRLAFEGLRAIATTAATLTHSAGLARSQPVTVSTPAAAHAARFTRAVDAGGACQIQHATQV